LEVVVSAVQNLGVMGAITYVWSLGKLDSGLAIVALLAVIGVHIGEKRLGSRSGAIVVVFATTALLQLIERLVA
jgi:hypothetical protein